MLVTAFSCGILNYEKKKIRHLSMEFHKDMQPTIQSNQQTPNFKCKTVQKLLQTTDSPAALRSPSPVAPRALTPPRLPATLLTPANRGVLGAWYVTKHRVDILYRVYSGCFVMACDYNLLIIRYIFFITTKRNYVIRLR